MCQEVRQKCECGQEEVQFHLRDNVMGPEVIEKLYCPNCSDRVTKNDDKVINDNGWIISYDMEIAHMFAITKLQIDPEIVNPEFLFDAGYATWREMYPGESEDISQERKEIIATRNEDPKGYLENIRNWNIERIERLKLAGWRKALQA